jgi:type III restriction enzyme
MIKEIKVYKTADLILQVSDNFDPLKLNLRKWDRFLDILCGDRTYQREAIKKAIIFLASGLYATTSELVRENWLNPKMSELKSRFRSFEDYIYSIQLPGKLAGTIDLATGTGKSYVIYGIGQIMLGMGLIDKVLILCPSLTIEEGLIGKFNQLTEDQSLLKAIPEDCVYKNPSIKTADVTIKDGDFCIENIHAVYEKTGSSIRDSFFEKGERTLVLNDESHHIYNLSEGRVKENKNLKKWKEFLLNKDFSFKYILGFTGTAYIKDDYFNDVIYRYSLKQAVNDKMVKMVDYVSKNDDAEVEIKFQEIYDNHQYNKDFYRKVKPLTIFVTKDISNAKRLASDFSEFICSKEDLNTEESNRKILVVSSATEHRFNIKRLRDVDLKDDLVEWIISVSMLTEGWDVKNVFQIVPWEDRAFNSKLLIAQVLGRGLRIPPDYFGSQPKVRVFNHDAWSRNIRGLVEEVLEIEMRLTSTGLNTQNRSQYCFAIHQINYDKETIEKESKKKQLEFDYTKGFIELQSQEPDIDKETEYTDLRGDVKQKNTRIFYSTYTVDWIVNKIFEELKMREWEGKILKLPTGNYSKENLPPRETIRDIIKNSMEKVSILGDRLIEKNMLKILSSFNTLLRKTGKTIVYERRNREPFIINIGDIERESIAIGNLRHGATVFYSSDYKKELNVELLEVLEAVIDDMSFPKSSSKEINVYLLKTPFDLVFTKYEPERKFIEHLCKVDNSSKINAWIKSRDVGFYSIEYSITSLGGKHSKVQSFNPDFFIKLRSELGIFYVIEIKADGDLNFENKAKLKYARQHFDTLNSELEKRSITEKYYFHFISPISFDVFFAYLRDDRLLKGNFRSELEVQLDMEDDG